MSTKPGNMRAEGTDRRGASHEYRLAPRDLVAPVMASVLALLAFLGVGPAARLGWIQPRGVLLNPDRAGFDWKREAAATGRGAEVVLSGDSSCTTGIDPTLGEAGRFRGRMVNLGLVIDLPWSAYADALRRGVTAHRDGVRSAVLLVSPQRLLHRVTGPYFEELWHGTYVVPAPDGPWLAGWMEHARTTWRASWPWSFVEFPLRGEGRQFYGFASTIAAFVDAHEGAFIDPGAYRPGRTRNDVDLAGALAGMEGLEEFGSAWRKEVPLWMGLAPIPESAAAPGFEAARAAAANRLVAATGADGFLSELPGVLPDPLFASPTHLNERGQRWYTRRLAEALARRFPEPRH